MEFLIFIKEWFPVISALVGVAYGGYRGMKTINNTLISIRHELELSNNRLEASANDRRKIWAQIESHSRRIYGLEEKTVRHDEKLHHLEKEN